MGQTARRLPISSRARPHGHSSAAHCRAGAGLSCPCRHCRPHRARPRRIRPALTRRGPSHLDRAAHERLRSCRSRKPFTDAARSSHVAVQRSWSRPLRSFMAITSLLTEWLAGCEATRASRPPMLLVSGRATRTETCHVFLESSTTPRSQAQIRREQKKARITKIRAYRNYCCHAVLMALSQTGDASRGSPRFAVHSRRLCFHLSLAGALRTPRPNGGATAHRAALQAARARCSRYRRASRPAAWAA